MRFFTCLLLSALFFSACNVINPDEQVPGYVTVDGYQVKVISGQGTASNGIREMWVYANDNNHGVYSVPCEVPVLQEGSTDITIFPGIWNNGLGNLRIRYPFMAAFDTTVVLKPNENVAITPKFEYVSGLDFDISRNFEGALNFNPVSPNQGTISQTTNPQQTFEGIGSAVISLFENQNYFLFTDVSSFSFFTGNTVFLEMDYSCNNSFTVGCYITDGPNTSKIGTVTMTPTTSDPVLPTWNKIYIDLGALGLINAGADSYRLYIEGSRSESDNPRIYLDNMKIIKFEE